MKVRMIWRYTIASYDKNDKTGGWWGTCEKRAKETLLLPGQKMVKTRVMWVGKIPDCPSCVHGFH